MFSAVYARGDCVMAAAVAADHSCAPEAEDGAMRCDATLTTLCGKTQALLKSCCLSQAFNAALLDVILHRLNRPRCLAVQSWRGDDGSGSPDNW